VGSSILRRDPLFTSRTKNSRLKENAWIDFVLKSANYQIHLLTGFFISQTWLPTVELVLQADLQGVWQARQSCFLSMFQKGFFATIFKCFISTSG
jgi:hypothetical protein